MTSSSKIVVFAADAFLQAGTVSVIASTAQVGDRVAGEVMAGYHALSA